MVNCIIIHGCPSNKEKAMDPETRTYDKHWIQWTKKELVSRGIPTEAPLMPTPWEPEYGRFKKEFEKLHVDEETVLIGHSCGCTFIVRWLSETKKRISKLVLVAPWKANAREQYKGFYEYEIDRTIPLRVKEIVIFTADDEAIDGKNGVKLYRDALGGKVIELPGRGHYIIKHMGTEEFPELIDAVLG